MMLSPWLPRALSPPLTHIHEEGFMVAVAIRMGLKCHFHCVLMLLEEEGEDGELRDEG